MSLKFSSLTSFVDNRYAFYHWSVHLNSCHQLKHKHCVYIVLPLILVFLFNNNKRWFFLIPIYVDALANVWLKRSNSKDTVYRFNQEHSPQTDYDIWTTVIAITYWYPCTALQTFIAIDIRTSMIGHVLLQALVPSSQGLIIIHVKSARWNSRCGDKKPKGICHFVM